MPPRKIKVVDVVNSNEPPEGQPVAAITDEPPEAENQPPEITTEPLEVVEPEVVEPEVVEPEVVEPEQPAKNVVSTTKTVDLVECPDCGKKMTMKTLKYSHAKNCTKNKKQQVEKEEEKEAEEEEEVKEEVKQVVEQPKPKPPPPKLKRTEQPPLKRTESEKPPPTIKRTISKAPEPVKPTITNVYGREQRNERVKLKTLKMNTLFSNAF